MPSEYDEQRDSTDTQLPGEYDLFDLMAKVTEENLHAPVDSGPPVGREALYFFRLPAYVVIRRYYILFLYFQAITDDFNTLRITAINGKYHFFYVIMQLR
ncbi:hypothetical protein FKF73_00210 [Aeromonas hydrophila]|nr:hypothetical protein [Aeromonas hydrophila]